LKQRVSELLKAQFERDVVLEKPKDRSFGHYATPIAFSLAKELRKSPMVIADELASSFGDHVMFSAVEATKGYINFRLSETFMNEYAEWALKHPELFGHADREGKILLEFVSANPTGPLHIGHARGAVYGDTLLRLGRRLGYDITAEYYVNDAGNQIDLLGVSLQLEGQHSVLNMEVEWPEKYYRGEYMTILAEEALNVFGSDILTNLDRQKELALWAKDKVMDLIVSDLADANIHFDTFVSEASLYDDWERVMKMLGEGVYDNDGKLWLRSSEYGDEKDRVVVREDGRPTYLAGDIVYHNRKFEQGFDHYINIWGADHHGYIARVKAAARYLGYNPDKLEILLSQMVSLLKDGEPYKMSKRAGNVILMSDIVEEIGPDALRFIFASKKSDTALEFDVEVLKKQDNSNPVYYINYAHARIQTMLSKSEMSEAQILAANLENLNEDADALLFEALLLPEVIEDAFASRQVQKLPEYLKSLAARLHKFYYDYRVLGTEEEAKLLKLFMMVALSIRVGLSLMGITAKDRMVADEK